jgi:ABC-type multidrug transport system fused ATPase/permease subunit
MADLVALFTVFFQGPADGMILQNIVSVGVGVLLLLGLIVLYGRHFEAMSGPGVVGFLVTFVGAIVALGAFAWAYSLAEQGWSLFFIWASLLSNLGWVLFGAVGLEARVYPRAAAILIVGVLLYGVANALIGSGAQNGALAGRLGYVVGVVVFDIIFNASIALLGFSLFRRRSVEHPPASVTFRG